MLLTAIEESGNFHPTRAPASSEAKTYPHLLRVPAEPLVPTSPRSIRPAKDPRGGSARGVLLEMRPATMLHIPSEDILRTSISLRNTIPRLKSRLRQFLEIGPSLPGSGLQKHLPPNATQMASILSQKRAIVCHLRRVRPVILPNPHELDPHRVTTSPGMATTGQKRTLSQTPMNPAPRCHINTRRILPPFRKATHSSE